MEKKQPEFLTEIKPTTIDLYYSLYHHTDAFDIANPSRMQGACHIQTISK